MNPNQKITYTVSWTQDPAQWNISSIIQLLEQARKQAVEAKAQLIEKQLEQTNFSQSLANEVISKIRAMK
jgi:hypothetical protein